METKQTAVTGGGIAPRVDWASMSDAQISYQADCFEKHDEEMPKALIHELRVRNHRLQALAEVRAEIESERRLGA